MEKIPQININHIAKLSKIKFNEENERKIEKELTKIIAYFNKIKELNIEKKEEKNFYTKTKIYLREDTPTPSIPVKEIQLFGTHFYKNYFIVPKII